MVQQGLVSAIVSVIVSVIVSAIVSMKHVADTIIDRSTYVRITNR